MDDLTAQVGLTRGALYHHFGDKKGLLAAVVEQIDVEMDKRLQAISDNAGDAWEGFRSRCQAYLEMALEPEFQRLVLRDARSVLGGASPEAQRYCVDSMRRLLDNLTEQGVIAETDSEALASLIYGSLAGAAFWIAEGDQGSVRLGRAINAMELMLRGLLVKP
jgi:AcrR family transcriptional regulator